MAEEIGKNPKGAGQAEAVLKDVKTILKPNGCLAVLEFKKSDGPPGPPKHIRLSEKGVDNLVLGHRFKKGSAVDSGDYTYLLTYRSLC